MNTKLHQLTFFRNLSKSVISPLSKSYEVSLKLIALVCLLSLEPKYFAVQPKEELQPEITFPHLLLQGWLILKSLGDSLNLLFRNKQADVSNLTFCFLGTFFWVPIPVKRYEIRSGYGPKPLKNLMGYDLLQTDRITLIL